MFSRTTIASSINIPIASERPSSDIVFSVKPNAYTAMKLDITDTGKGIPKNKLDSVFMPGFTTKKRGWGLGLALAKRIIENYHEGKLFVKWSEVGRGTTFRVVLNQ